MAKLWEVLKAFDEGTSKKATRYTTRRLVELNKNLGNDGVSIYFDGSVAAFSVGDFEATDWHIIESKEHKTFDHIIIVHQVLRDQQNPFTVVGAFNNTSLFEARGITDYIPIGITKLVSAVGITNEGETIILVQEGETVE